MYTRSRLSLVEYGAPVDLSYKIAASVGADRSKANNLLLDAGRRVSISLGLNYNPISIDPVGARAIDFSGLVRLTPSLELEVAPKFLGGEDADSTWREDFFFLATLSRHGRLLPAEHLSASSGVPRDLPTLVARSIASMYEACKRRPVRSYRQVKQEDFFIEGDPDPIDLIFPSPEGFEQEVTRFDRQNSWNADIVAAAKTLLPEVNDPSAAGFLIRLIGDLSPQNVSVNRRKPIPARHRAWKPLHELSVDVLGGLGVNYKMGRAQSPGYLVATWRIWEDLLLMASRMAFGRSAAITQKGFTLGTKIKRGATTEISFSVFPDCVIEGDGLRERFILDAKYKGHVEKGQVRIAESDIYEALAFSRATCCNLVVLAYPAIPTDKPLPVGTCTLFETIRIDTVQIFGVQIESRLISKVGALHTFAMNLAAGIPALFSM